ncbi:MAG: S8/S53 family peptidase [Pelagimonas sp.]|nr:S8/S53 family peptidase [Pelagimonas sp.]
MTTKIPTHNGDPLFLGAYPSYHALWHLHEIGVLKMDPADPTGATYQDDSPLFAAASGARENTIVAMIDTSVAWDHPCLAEAIDHDLMIDFAGDPRGALINGDVPDSLKGLTPQHYGDDILNTAAQKLVERFNTPPADLGRAAAAQAHATHGTAMAGIIGARPATVKVHRSQMLNPAAQVSTLDLALRYTGADPFCKIVPISTSAMPTADEMIKALIYAEMIGAHVIVLAASLQTPDSMRVIADARTPDEIDTRALGTRARHKTEAVVAGEDALNTLFLKVSEHRPILCAAGNDGSGRVSYPARLARKDNGIVAVAAHSASGVPCAYSPDDAKHITIYAPSGDMESMTRSEDGGYELRLDPYRLRRDHHNDQGLFDRISETDGTLNADHLMQPQEILTTDCPGPNGYNPGNYLHDPFVNDAEETVHLDPSSLFCTFSGTSAATAVTAGMVSLGMATGALPRGGAGFDPQVFKSALRGTDDSDATQATPKLRWVAPPSRGTV